jgi:hypothetical protein
MMMMFMMIMMMIIIIIIIMASFGDYVDKNVHLMVRLITNVLNN